MCFRLHEYVTTELSGTACMNHVSLFFFFLDKVPSQQSLLILQKSTRIAQHFYFSKFLPQKSSDGLHMMAGESGPAHRQITPTPPLQLCVTRYVATLHKRQFKYCGNSSEQVKRDCQEVEELILQGCIYISSGAGMVMFLIFTSNAVHRPRVPRVTVFH